MLATTRSTTLLVLCPRAWAPYGLKAFIHGWETFRSKYHRSLRCCRSSTLLLKPALEPPPSQRAAWSIQCSGEFMLVDDKSDHQDIPTALRWIVERCNSRHPRQRSRAIRIVVGKSVIEEHECAPDENVVTVSEAGIIFWFRPYSEPGAPRIAGAKLNGLFDFMRIAIWPQIVDEWGADRLMLEPQLDEAEIGAIKRYKELQEEGKRLNSEDIENLLEGHPHLQRLYSAITGTSLLELQRSTEHCAEELAEIGVEHVRTLVNAIESGDQNAAKSQRSSLIFRILLTAVETMPFEVRFTWHSQAYDENTKMENTQLAYLIRLANRRYSKEFENFSSSGEILNINDRYFSGPDQLDQQAYKAQLASFMAEKLASPNFLV
ncbi:hypothetical protein SAMN05518800_6975 [Variovorax sp. YR752]|nr:hypothetical protein SAMN05518800_6975 [Variovorax sp. YR752]